jgi:hypothetical protein
VPGRSPVRDAGAALKLAGGCADAPGMPTHRRLLNGAAVAALVVALPTVTAGAAVRGDGNGNHGNWNNGNGGWDSGNGNNGNGNTGNGNGNAPAQTPASGANPSAPATPPGRAQNDTAASPLAGVPGQSGSTPASGETAPSGAAPATSPAAAPIPVAPPAEPVLGESMAVEPVSGRVQIRLPDSSGYVSLADAGSIPTGSVVDARRGTLTLQSALDAEGRVQTATVRGAVFEVRQSATGNGVTDLVLRGGPPASCTASTGRIAAVAAKQAKPGALWARDSHGRFRTKGRNSVATVRGTRWSTRETCAGTVTRVMQGAVDVRDLRTGRTVTVRRGHAYLARTSG